MISKITYSPRAFLMQNNCCGPKKMSNVKNTVSFGNAKVLKELKKCNRTSDTLLNNVVKNVFNKLAENRFGNDLGTFLASTKNADVYVRETKFGKEAQVSLSNGIFEGKSYLNLKLKRSTAQSPKVISTDENLSCEDAKKYIETYLSDLK